MLKVNFHAPSFNPATTISFEQVSQRLSNAAQKVVSRVNEKSSPKPLDLNYDEILEDMVHTKNPFTGKVKYVSTHFLDTYF